jgi:hypothetical protein
MTEPNTFLLALTGISMIVSFPVAIYAFYKSFNAKSFFEQAKYSALFVAPVLITFALGELAGVTKFPRFSDVPETTLSVPELFAKMPALQIGLVIVAGLIVIAGNKLLMDSHQRRTGKSWWDMANPFKPLIGNYDKREKLIFIIILVAGMTFGFGAIIV